MRGHVRDAVPPPDDGTLEVLVGVSATAPDRDSAAVGAEAPPSPTLPLPRELGPNGDRVADLLERAAAMSAAETRALDAEATWRWGMLTPLPVAGGVATVRAIALLRARRDGRTDAIRMLDSAVAHLGSGRAWRRRRLAVTAVVAAGLAVLARDLLDSDEFETLFGPWRAVMHH